MCEINIVKFIENIVNEYRNLLNDVSIDNPFINMNSNIVRDVIHATSDKFLILESPHREELYSGIPLSGDTGEYVGKVINPIANFGLPDDCKFPFGPYVKNINNSNFGIINVSQLALQQPSNATIKSTTLKYLLESIRTSPNSELYKSERFESLKLNGITVENLYDAKIEIKTILFDNFSTRMNNIIDFQNKKFLLCGNFANIMFLDWLKTKIADDEVRTRFIFTNVFKVAHPSSKWSQEDKDKVNSFCQ